MAASGAEQTHTIDQLPAGAALAAMLQSHMAAANAVNAALPEIEAAAQAFAETLRNGRTITYAAAGSSGLMALSDACELPGTFGIPNAQIRILMAGGIPSEGQMPGASEDDGSNAGHETRDMQPGDLALILSASGSTPYALAMAAAAQARGARVVAIANAPDTPLLARADIAICLPTAPEVIAGSTRLGAGTAQKIALNMISTLAAVLLGHVHNGMMVNMITDNIKLRKRAVDIVCKIANVTPQTAQTALIEADYDTKLATLLAAGHRPDAARSLLAKHGGHLRPCLAEHP